MSGILCRDNRATLNAALGAGGNVDGDETTVSAKLHCGGDHIGQLVRDNKAVKERA